MRLDRATLTVLVSALLIASSAFAVTGAQLQTENETNGTETPIDGEETPVDGDDNITDGEDNVTDGEDNVTDGEDNVTDGDDNITDGEDNITDGEENVTDGEENVTEEGELAISSVTAPQSATPEEPFTVEAVIENTGQQEATERVELRLDGQVLDRQSVTVGPDEEENVSFNVSTTNLSSGEYALGVYTESDGHVQAFNLSESFTVEGLSAPSEATSGDNITVEATVSNPNDFNTTQNVTYRFSGGVIEEANLSLEGGASETITLEVPLNGLAEGTYFHGLFARNDGQVAPINVAGGNFSDEGTNVTISDQSTTGDTVVVDNVTVPRGGFVTVHNDSILEGEVVGSVIGVSDYLEPGTHENVEVHLYDFPGSPSAPESMAGNATDGNVTDGENATEDGATTDDENATNGENATEDGATTDDENATEDGATTDEGATADGEEMTVIAMPHLDTNGNQMFDFVRSNGTTDGPYVVNGSVVTASANLTIGEEPAGPPGEGEPGEEEPGEGEPGETPEEPGETPEEPGETPEEPGETPEEPGETPEEPGETPEEPGATPGETPEEPDAGDGTPDGDVPPGDSNQTETPEA